MAIKYINAGALSRSKGHNSVKSAAYRANEDLYCELTGKTYNYTGKGDCVYKDILLPDSAYANGLTKENHPFSDRNNLWNAVEEIENSHNRRATALLSMELKVALPKELLKEQQIDLINSFVKDNYLSRFNIAADVCIHDKGDNNPHAHVMFTFREINGNEFCKIKLRNLMPQVRGHSSNYFVIEDQLSQQWENYQNNYFQKHDIDLVVDQGHIKPTIHEGRIDQPDNYAETQAQKNFEIKKENIEAVKENHELIIDTLEKRQAVFTKRDIENLVFKSCESEQDYNDVLSKVIASDKLINLGYAENGRVSFTTKGIYHTEVNLADNANGLSGRSGFDISNRAVHQVSNSPKFTLEEEQAQALKYISESGDLCCLVGRAGSGKTHTLKAVKELYENQGYTISGTAIQAKVVHGLTNDAKIESNTIYSILDNYKKGNDQYLPKDKSILVVDEAGMIGLEDLSLIVKMCKEKQMKLVLVGDPDQLQPVSYGAPLRAIMERVGFSEMSVIRRQKDEQDKIATHNLSKGNVGLAIDHYASKDSVTIAGDDLEVKLLSQWKAYADKDLSKTLMIAFTNEQITSLNHHARAYLKDQGVLTDSKIIDIEVSNKKLQREFAINDRIVFLKNKNLDGVKVANGQLATIVNMNNDIIEFKLDEDSKVHTLNTKDFNNFDHGYATTVHKSQGVTVDNCLVYAKGFGWDRFMSYVAMTRHKYNMHLFADKETYGDLQGLKRQLARTPLRDNVLDYPLQFAIRRGRDAEIFANNAVGKIKGLFHKVKAKWNYLFNYEKVKLKSENELKEQGIYNNLAEKQAIHKKAVLVADLSDQHRASGKAYNEFVEKYGKNWYENKEAKLAFEDIDQMFLERNKLAHEVLSSKSDLTRALELNNITPERLSEWSKAHINQIRVDTFANIHNPYQKGKLAQEILDNKDDCAKYLSKRDLWQEVYKYQHENIVRVKSGQIEGFSEANNLLNQYLDHCKDATKYYKKSIADHYTADSIKHDAKGREIKPEHQQRYANLSKLYNRKAETLASKIITDFENHHQALAVKFSHQPTYEKVLDRIKSNADRYEKRETIKAYINPESTQLEREKAAYKLNQDFKAHVGIGYEEGLIWGSVARTAYPEKIRQVRNSLDEKYIPLFDAVQSYQEVCQNSAQAYVKMIDAEKLLKITLNLKPNADIPKDKLTDTLKSLRNDMYKAMAYRHEVAYELNDSYSELNTLYRSQPTKLDKILPNFKYDRFNRHVVLHEERLEAKARVTQFIASDSKEERMALAYSMTQRMGKHTFFLNEKGVEAKSVWKLSNEYTYILDNNKYEGADKELHRKLADYMLIKEQVSNHWRSIRTLKSQGNTKDSQSLQSHGFKLSEERNKVAFEVCQLLGRNIESPVFEEFTQNKKSYLNIDLTQLIKFGESYRIIDDINKYISKENTKESSLLASNLCDRYKQGMLYHKLKSLNVDTKKLYDQASAYKREIYHSDLSDTDRIYHNTVINYSKAVIDVAKAYKENDKDRGKDLIIGRDKLAVKIAENYSLYEEILLFEEVNLDKLDKHVEHYKISKQYDNSLDGVDPSIFSEDIPEYYNIEPVQKNRNIATKQVKSTWNAELINNYLLNNPVDTYSQIFGAAKKVSSTEMRWSGGLIVTLTGSHKGAFYDFSQDKGGYPINAIMSETGRSYVEALEEGARIAGLSTNEAQTQNEYTPSNTRMEYAKNVKDQEQKEKEQKIHSARSIYNACVPAFDTIVEQYMAVHRNIYDISRTELKLLPVGAKWIDYVDNKPVEKINKVPAMVIASHNEKCEVIGVQRTYLDEKTANKNTYFDNPKLSKGSIKNGAVLQTGNNGIVYIAEGIETGASVALADKDATVLISMSVGNMKNMLKTIQSHNPTEVIILKDNDGENAKSDIGFKKAVEEYKKSGLTVSVKEPEMLDRIIEERGKDKAKTDWNDIIQDKGLNGLRKDLKLPVPQVYDRMFLQRLDEWKKIENQIPGFAKNKDHVNALRDFSNIEHSSAIYIRKAYKKSNSHDEFVSLCNSNHANKLKSLTKKFAKNLANHENGFKVAKQVGLHERLAHALGVKYSNILLLSKDQRKELISKIDESVKIRTEKIKKSDDKLRQNIKQKRNTYKF